MARGSAWLGSALSQAGDPARPGARGRARKRQTLDQIIRSAGGKRALARRMAGLERGGRLPRKGTKARRDYDSAYQALRRSEKVGQINPRTGRPFQARPGTKRIQAIGKQLRSEKRLLRKREIVLRNVRATTRINGTPDYDKERSFGDVRLTRAEFREIVKAEREGRTEVVDRLIGEAILNTRPNLRGAKGIARIDITEVESGEIE